MSFLVSFFLLVGSILMFLAALGIVRFPDLYSRLHSASKASSLALTCFLIGAGIFFGEVIIWFKVLVAMGFLYLTIPLASHVLARTGYAMRLPFWSGTKVDELAQFRASSKDKIQQGKSKTGDGDVLD